ncbi:MAG TPA: glycosyltransferase [Geminicoccaceae bacterium]|nr:glycosyltransferase [Geminicoccaceae bacterium]
MFVSVVMPVYNGRWFLREAIGSVLAQTHRDLELVAVDDGSTDDSPAILRELAAADSRLRVIRQENGGGARARNRALAEARAEWIVNLDQDDVMLPNRIERQLAFIAAHRDVKVFSCRAYYINTAGKIFGKTKCEPITTRAAFERYLASGEAIGINHPAAALHRPTIRALGGYRPAYEGAEDIDLWNRVAEHGHLVLQQDEVLMKYRIHGTSVMASRTRQSWEKGEWTIACMQARRAGRPEPGWDAYRAELRTLPWWRRLQRERLMQARVHYRVAGFDVANRRWLRGAGHLLLAGAAKPSYVLDRLAAQVTLAWQRTEDAGGGADRSRPAEAPAR